MVSSSRFVSALLVVLFLTAVAAPLTIQPSSGASDAAGLDLVQRGRIAILDDADFTAENGVVSGTGSSGDPYIIEGWEITLSNSSTCIVVTDTNSYFIIRDVYLANAMTGIRMSMLNHATVTRAVIDNCSVGVSASYTDVSRVDNTVISNCSIGMSLRYCDQFKLSSVTFVDDEVDMVTVSLPWLETRQANLLFAAIAIALGAFVVILLYMRFRYTGPPGEMP